MEIRMRQNLRAEAPHRKCALLSAALTLLVTTACSAQVPATQPWPGVSCVHEQQPDPPESVFVVKIDLTKPDVAIRVAPGGPDPDGPGPWQTTLQPVSAIAQREGLDIAVNASFFEAKNTKDAEGVQSGYVKEKWS